MRRASALAARHVELLLTVSGVFVAIVLTFTVAASRLGAALTFLVWFQGFALWGARRYARLREAVLFARLRAMLQDRVNNQLTVMLTATESSQRLAPLDREALEQASAAARTVADELANLSPDSLASWESRHGHALATMQLLRPGASAYR